MSRSLGSFLAPTGSKLDGPDNADGHMGTLSTLPEATGELIKVASRHFVEAKAKDFEIVGKSFVDRATGQHYRPAADPFLSDAPAESGVVVFIVSGGRVLFLKRRGDPGRVTTQAIGTLSSGKVSPVAGSTTGEVKIR